MRQDKKRKMTDKQISVLSKEINPDNFKRRGISFKSGNKK